MPSSLYYALIFIKIFIILSCMYLVTCLISELEYMFQRQSPWRLRSCLVHFLNFSTQLMIWLILNEGWMKEGDNLTAGIFQNSIRTLSLLPIQCKCIVELNVMLVSQITRRQHFQRFYQLHHCIIVLLARGLKVRKAGNTALCRFFWTVTNMRPLQHLNTSLSLQATFSDVKALKRIAVRLKTTRWMREKTEKESLLSEVTKGPRKGS